jgi:hypothetical protein
MRPSARARLRRIDPELAARLEADANIRIEEAAKQLRRQLGMEE